MKLRLLTVITCIPLLTFAQQTITLEQCYQAAEANFPLNGQSQHLIDITDANLLKINAIIYPARAGNKRNYCTPSDSKSLTIISSKENPQYIDKADKYLRDCI